jgi:hypothetical protein
MEMGEPDIYAELQRERTSPWREAAEAAGQPGLADALRRMGEKCERDREEILGLLAGLAKQAGEIEEIPEETFDELVRMFTDLSELDW